MLELIFRIPDGNFRNIMLDKSRSSSRLFQRTTGYHWSYEIKWLHSPLPRNLKWLDTHSSLIPLTGGMIVVPWDTLTSSEWLSGRGYIEMNMNSNDIPAKVAKLFQVVYGLCHTCIEVHVRCTMFTKNK